MSPYTQMALWIIGNPLHNTERDECTPDFSCCSEGQIAPRAEREAFCRAMMDGDEAVVLEMLGGFLSGIVPDGVYVGGLPPAQGLGS